MDENNNFNQTNQDNTAFEIPEKKKKKSAAPFLAAGIVAVCTGVGVAAVKGLSPKASVKAEVTKNYTDFISRETIYSQIKDENIAEILANGEYTVEGGIKLDENSGSDKLSGLGLQYSNVVSVEQKKASLDMMADYNGVDLVRIMISCDENSTRAHIPALFSESFYIENKNILEQLSKSQVLGQYASNAMDEIGEVSIEPFALAEANKASYALNKKVKELWKDALKEAGDALVYEKGEKMTAPNGKETDSYIITWPVDSAKSTALKFLNGIKDSEEYKQAINAQAEFLYASEPDMEQQAGSKEDFEKQASEEFEDMIKKVESANFEDIKITALPTENGMIFKIAQAVNDTNVKMDLEYNRDSKSLKVNAVVESGEKKTVLTYDDSITVSDGIISENHNFTSEEEDEKFVLASTAQFNKADGTVDGSVTASDGEDNKVKADYKGNIVKSDGKFQADNVTLSLSNGEDSVKLSGNLTVKKREEDPREINSSSEIKLSELGVVQAMKLYNEAKDNLKSIADIIG